MHACGQQAFKDKAPRHSLDILHTPQHLPLMAGSDGSVALVQALGCCSTFATRPKMLPGGHLCQQGMTLLQISLHIDTLFKDDSTCPSRSFGLALTGQQP